MVSETTTDKKVSWNAESNPAKPVTFEILEPRILLSGDGLLNITPDPLDSLIDTTPQIVQYAELLETSKQAEEQTPSDTAIYQPIFTVQEDFV